MPTATPTGARTVELYQLQGGGLVPLLVRSSAGDTEDIEAMIAAAIAAHNTDPEAHPDIRRALKEAGGGLVTTPVLTLAERLPIGAVATLSMTAQAGLNGAYVASFNVTMGDAEPVTVEAADDAAEYAFTPSGNAGDTVSVSVVATDTFGNRSRAATATATLVSPPRALYHFKGQQLLRSTDDGLTWDQIASNLSSATQVWTVFLDGAPARVHFNKSSSTLAVETWSDSEKTLKISSTCPYTAMSCNSLVQANNGTILVSGKFREKSNTTNNFNGTLAIYEPSSASWSFLLPTGGMGHVFGLTKTNSGRLMYGATSATGSSSHINMSSDNGVSWGLLSSPSKVPKYFYMNADVSMLYAAETDSDTATPFLMTSTTSVSWKSCPTSGTPLLKELFSQMLVSDTGTLHGIRNKIYVRSTDGGLTWDQPTTAVTGTNAFDAATIAIGPVTYSTTGT